MVVSPLVALMDDQMAELARVGVPGIRVTAETTKEESRDLRQRLLDPATTHLVRWRPFLPPSAPPRLD